MNIYDSLFSFNDMLSKQLGSVFEYLTEEQGPLVALVDKEGKWCPESAQRYFDHMREDDEQVRRICSRIDDGGEPVIAQLHDCGVVATDLTVGKIDCGYLFVLLPDYSPEATMRNIELAEMIIRMAGALAEILDKNNQLNHEKLKNLSFSINSRD